MVHLPLEGSLEEARGLRAVRPEAIGNPQFTHGGILPEPGRRHAVRLVVSNLARIALWGRTPSTGTIVLSFERLSENGGEGERVNEATLLVSDPPLNLEVTIGAERLVASFTDRGGVRRRIETPGGPVDGEDGGYLVAVGWDASAGLLHAAWNDSRSVNRTEPFEMPGLPDAFQLGAPGIVLDEFRLYRRLLDGEEVGVARRP